MKLIVDSNRMIAALISDGLARAIINSGLIEFCTLSHVIEEVNKYKEYIVSKSGLEEKQIDLLFSLLMQNVEIVSEELVRAHMSEALALMKNIDVYDAPILACALAIQNEGIWTEDKHLAKQNKVTTWKTDKLREYLT